jgi:hypothetical protein
MSHDQEIERVQIELGFLLLRRAVVSTDQVWALELCIQAAEDRIDELQYTKLETALHDLGLEVQKLEKNLIYGQASW